MLLGVKLPFWSFITTMVYIYGRNQKKKCLPIITFFFLFFLFIDGEKSTKWAITNYNIISVFGVKRSRSLSFLRRSIFNFWNIIVIDRNEYLKTSFRSCSDSEVFFLSYQSSWNWTCELQLLDTSVTSLWPLMSVRWSAYDIQNFLKRRDATLRCSYRSTC